jgi:G3E family GTPase
MHNGGEKTPVTVIAGYLGAGKTTLINACLKTRGKRKIAVLVNDFGDINIDAALIESQTDTVLNLAGGCVCCSIGSDFMDSLSELAALAQKFDHVLVETSGVALPKPIAQSIALSLSFELDAIFVLADGETIEQHMRDAYVGDLVRQQLLQADCILLTKLDHSLQRLASLDGMHAGMPGQPAQVSTLVKALGKDLLGPIFAFPGEAYSCDWLLKGSSDSGRARAAKSNSSLSDDSHWLMKPDGQSRYKSLARSDVLAQQGTEIFESLAIELDAPIDLGAISAALLALAQGPAPMLLRAKGFIRDRPRPLQWQLLQMVGQRISLSDLPAQSDTVNQASAVLVLIGFRREMLSRQAEIAAFVELLQK